MPYAALVPDGPCFLSPETLSLIFERSFALALLLTDRALWVARRKPYVRLG